MPRNLVWCLALAIILAAGIACSDARRDDGRRQGEAAREDAARAADKAEDAVKRGAARASDAARDAVDATRDALDKARSSDAARQAAEAGAAATSTAAELTRSAATAVSGGAVTATVKTALMADRGVDASDINVDTDEIAKTVTLKGRVSTAAERTRAEAIARAKAPGYRIVDAMTVGPPA